MKDLLKYLIPLQPKFRKVMGEWQDGDAYVVLNAQSKEVRDKVFYCSIPGEDPPYEWQKPIWIPRTIDDSSEEARRRSLLGMLDGFITLEKHYDIYRVITLIDGNFRDYLGQTSTECYLKALCCQWGMEVKGEGE